MKLISMVDYILQEKKVWSGNENEYYEIGKSVVNYATFLNQPLKLEMFVPCDGEGNVLEEPIPFSCTDAEYSKWCKAQEKVLFEGFRILDNKEQVFCTLGMGKLIITYDYKTKTFLLQKDWTVERLVKLSLILIPTAIKQIQP